MADDKTTRRRLLALAATLTLALAVGVPAVVLCQPPGSLRPTIAARYPEIGWVDRPTLHRWLEEPTPPVLLDSRTEAEFAVSHLRGARRIDPDHPERSFDDIPRDRRIVVYCSVGWRSGGVADALRRAGFREVYNLEGGIFGWANADCPVFRDGQRVRQVHPYDETWGRMLDEEYRAYEPG